MTSLAAATTIAATDKRLLWSGAVSLQQGEGWVMPWRLPHDELEMFPPEGLQESAAMPAGVRLRFATDALTLTLATEPLPNEGNLDLYANSLLIGTQKFQQGETSVTFADLPAGMKTVEIWLHQMTPFRLRSIQLAGGKCFEKCEDSRPKWITYGSSISHCGAAASPSFTWPGVVARARGLNLTGLGFGGQCHLDPMIAKLIGDLPADFVSVKLGINVCGAGSLNPRTFLPAVLGTLFRIREGHPEIPFAVCSPICSPPRENTPNLVEITLEIMRAEIAKAVEIFRRRGDRNIFYIDGLKLFGPELADYLPDEVHPNAEGYKRLGQNFIREVFEKLGVEVGAAP